MERKNNKLLIFLLLFLSISIFSYASIDEAYNLYLSGLKAYRSGDYENAQNFLNSALEKSPKIENEVPEIKLYLGLSAFQNQDYKISYQYLSLFPDNALAQESLKSIENNLLTEDIDLGDLVIKTSTTSATSNEESNLNFGSFITITLIIFTISILSAISVWFLLKRFSSFDFSRKTSKSNESLEEEEDTEEDIEPISLEEVINLKLDNLESIWQKSIALKKLLGEIDEELTYDVEKEGKSDPTKLKKMIDDSMKDVNIDELENILDDFDNENETDEVESEEKSYDLKMKDEENTSKVTKKINNEEKSDEESIEEVDLDEVKNNWQEFSDSIKPDQVLKNSYNNIMKENEEEIIREAENFNDLDSLIEEIEANNKDKGRKEYTENQIESIFKTNFFEINDEKIK